VGIAVKRTEESGHIPFDEAEIETLATPEPVVV
jgi:hypothetical protein